MNTEEKKKAHWWVKRSEEENELIRQNARTAIAFCQKGPPPEPPPPPLTEEEELELALRRRIYRVLRWIDSRMTRRGMEVRDLSRWHLFRVQRKDVGLIRALMGKYSIDERDLYKWACPCCGRGKDYD